MLATLLAGWGCFGLYNVLPQVIQHWSCRTKLKASLTHVSQPNVNPVC